MVHQSSTSTSMKIMENYERFPAYRSLRTLFFLSPLSPSHPLKQKAPARLLALSCAPVFLCSPPALLLAVCLCLVRSGSLFRVAAVCLLWFPARSVARRRTVWLVTSLCRLAVPVVSLCHSPCWLLLRALAVCLLASSRGLVVRRPLLFAAPPDPAHRYHLSQSRWGAHIRPVFQLAVRCCPASYTVWPTASPCRIQILTHVSGRPFCSACTEFCRPVHPAPTTTLHYSRWD